MKEERPPPPAEDAAALSRLAREHQLAGRPRTALKLWDRVLRRGGATVDVLRFTGDALVAVGEYAQALGAYRHGLALDDGRADLHHGLGRALYRLGETDEAARELETAIGLGAGLASWLSLSAILPGCPGADAQRVLEVRSACVSVLAEAFGPIPADTTRRARRSGPVHVGYISAFFDRENYMKPVWGLLNGHDRSAVRVHLFSDVPCTPRWPGYDRHEEDRLHETADLDNDALASLVEEAGLDVLVDLNGYSVPERLAFFLSRRAPVTLSWFNAFATSGLPGLRYVVGDGEWEIKLPDLRTRIAVTPRVRIGEPDDALFAQLIELLFADRGLVIPPDVLRYIVERVHRDYWTAERVVEAVDRFAIAERARLTVPTVRRALADAGIIDRRSAA